MRVVNNIDIEQWASFVQEHPHGNIFHSPEMFDVFQKTSGYEPVLWAVENFDEQILALFIPVELKLNSFLSTLTTRAVSFGGVLCVDNQDGQEALRMLLETYVEENEQPPLFTELRNLSSVDQHQPLLHDCGFVYDDHLNYLIDIDKPEQEVFECIGRRTRKNIRRGLNRDIVHVERVTGEDQLEECIKLIERTYQNANIPLAHSSMFYNAFDILSTKGMIHVSLASVEGQPAATSIELLYKSVIYGWYSGLDRRFSRYVPNELLMWDILKWGAASDYQTYDFGGAGKPNEEYGVRDFKAKFGGNLVNFGRNTYVHRPKILNLSKAGYQIYQKISSLRTA